MSSEIENVIFSEPVLLSPPFDLGEFVTRHFYHAISGFGTVKTQYNYELSDNGVSRTAEANIVYHDFGEHEGCEVFWWRECDDAINVLNDEVLDDETLVEMIKEMIIYQLEPTKNDSTSPETSPQPPCVTCYPERREKRYRTFNLRQPVDIDTLQQALEQLKKKIPYISDTYIMPAITPTILSVVISTENPSDWIKRKRNKVVPSRDDQGIMLHEFVSSTLRRVVEKSPSDPRLHISTNH